MPAGFMFPARNMPSMIGLNATADGFGSSSGLTLGQPNMIEGEMMYNNNNNASDDQDFEYKSGSENPEGGSGDEQEQPSNKKKRYHRHTQHQIHEMEAFFKECPHPDDKQRKELSRELGLEPLQIKFWFQNKRTQLKTQHERHENTQLRAENDKLRADSMRYREALNNASCPNCGGRTAIGEMSIEEHNLRLENAQLRDEIDRMAAMAAKYVGKPVVGNHSFHSLHVPSRPLELRVGSLREMYGTEDLLRSTTAPSEADKPMMIELAVGAMEELIKMAQMAEPLWTTSIDGTTAILNENEYSRLFPSGIGPKSTSFVSEASRETAVVMMNPISLVEILMDVDQWATVFAGIVSRAFTQEVLSTGVAGNYDGALQLMTAEFQAPTPFVPTRESYFARYCKQHTDGTWAVVDVSLDNLLPSPVVKCRRRPSGCLIQEMPVGYSKVTWVEHVEVSDTDVHRLYKNVVSSGSAFGAKRWIGTLDRQCERLASVMATNMSNGDFGVLRNEDGRRSMLKLSERMAISFCDGVSASTAQIWEMLSVTGADDVRVMIRKSIDDPGRPPGIVLSAATSLWLHVPPKRVFDFLRDENSRSKWDILSNGGVVQEAAHVANGRDTGNCVSLLRVNSENVSQSNMLILQESFTDETTSYVIYAPVDMLAMNVVLSGGDSDYVALLPSGFAILPDGPQPNGGGISETESWGSLLTVAFQILIDSVPTAKLSLRSVTTVNNLIASTVERIKTSLSPANA